ncbi:MAG: acylneuraminate cytidylyltransferase family protein [Myxococcaceae bacterium]|nr:acylneuraminate cytidylyltransferase family protein [Myxococcaceae bacterium]
MNTLAVITARGGSKRIPRKNLRLLGGKPLVAWMLEAALASKRLTRVVLSSEDDEILAVAGRVGASVPLRRPAELATDTAPSVDVVRHAVAEVERADARRFDAVVTLQPTTPLTVGADIDGCIAAFEETRAETVVSVTQLQNVPHPAKLKVMGEGNRLLPWLEEERGRMAAHQLPTIYVRNGAMYVTRRDVLERNVIIGDDCRGFVMPADRSVDLNYEIDWQFLEFLMSRRGVGGG